MTFDFSKTRYIRIKPNDEVYMITFTARHFHTKEQYVVLDDQYVLTMEEFLKLDIEPATANDYLSEI